MRKIHLHLIVVLTVLMLAFIACNGGNNNSDNDNNNNNLPTPVAGVSLNKSSLTLVVGDSETLRASVNPTKATNQSVLWSSSVSSVATVSSTGWVTAIAGGETVITATTDDGGYTASCELSVCDIYVAGYYAALPSLPRAKVWKNGSELYELGSSTSYANSVFVTDDRKVYVAGHDNSASRFIAKVWRNGIAENLNSLNNSYANSVFVSGNNVYVAGYEIIGPISIAAYWKNGAIQALTSGTNSAQANSICVLGNDVYVAGYESNGTRDVAKVWINGQAQNLTSGANNAQAKSVSVSNTGVVCVAGYDNNGTIDVAKVWINGQVQNLTNGTYNARAHAVYAIGSDVFVTGYESTGMGAYDKDVVKVWKNGSVIYSFGDGFYGSQGNSIFVLGTDVYVAGSEYVQNRGRTARLWKNGVLQNLDATVNYTFGLSVFVR
jgi:hypothetical protein